VPVGDRDRQREGVEPDESWTPHDDITVAVVVVVVVVAGVPQPSQSHRIEDAVLSMVGPGRPALSRAACSAPCTRRTRRRGELETARGAAASVGRRK
jgi:hypothetical protein